MGISQARIVRGKVPDFLGPGAGRGYGDGYGHGFEDGEGEGSGPGYADGSGDGYGDGFSYGYGDDHGYGNGDGFGDTYGYAYGEVHGDGSESGYGPTEYWLPYFAGKLPEPQRQRLAELQQAGAVVAFWCTDVRDAVAPGMVEEVSGPLPKNAPRATFIYRCWRAERWWLVAMTGEIRTERHIIYALKREIIGECL
jgi:hypothetical protein